MSARPKHIPLFSADGRVLNKQPKPKSAPQDPKYLPYDPKTTVLGKYASHKEIPRPPKVMVMSVIAGDAQGLEWDVTTGSWKTIHYINAGAEGAKQWLGFAVSEHQTRVMLEKDRGMPKNLIDTLMTPVDASWLQANEVQKDGGGKTHD